MIIYYHVVVVLVWLNTVVKQNYGVDGRLNSRATKYLLTTHSTSHDGDKNWHSLRPVTEGSWLATSIDYNRRLRNDGVCGTLAVWRWRTRHLLLLPSSADPPLPQPPRLLHDLVTYWVLWYLFLVTCLDQSWSIMIRSISSSDQFNFIERLESANRAFHPAWKRSLEVKLSL